MSDIEINHHPWLCGHGQPIMSKYAYDNMTLDTMTYLMGKIGTKQDYRINFHLIISLFSLYKLRNGDTA